MAERQLYIHGGYTSATSGHTFGTINLANGNVLAAVQVVEHEDVDRTVKSTQQGQKIWAAMAAMGYSRTLCWAVDTLRERNGEFAKLKTPDTGKAYPETSAVDIVTDADVLECYAGLIPTLEGGQIPLHEASFACTRRKSLGVVTGIGAWNYPIQIALWKPAPTLAVGNAMIFKPSRVTPLTVLRLAEIYSEAGLLGGVFSMLPGVGVEIGQYLIDYPGIARVSFTGDVANGKKVMVNSVASSLKEVTTELDGKSPLIVFDDVDLDLAADIAMMADLFSSDQVYTNGARVFVPTKYKAAFEQKALARAGYIRVGDVSDSQTNFGPLVSFPHYDNVLHYVVRSKEESARVLCGGNILKGGNFDSGIWITPIVFTDCSDDMTIVCEEILGPVISTLTYESEGEVIRRANDIDYGLATSIVMAGLNRVHRVIHRPEAGICRVNTWGKSPAEIPVGDYGHSGIGRENGVMTLQSYTQVRPIQVEMTKFQSIF